MQNAVLSPLDTGGGAGPVLIEQRMLLEMLADHQHEPSVNLSNKGITTCAPIA